MLFWMNSIAHLPRTKIQHAFTCVVHATRTLWVVMVHDRRDSILSYLINHLCSVAPSNQASPQPQVTTVIQDRTVLMSY